nr:MULTISPECIES: hypothetical protein [unclassified Wolbachia]
MIPFINKNQSLSQLSIKEISKLIDNGVKPENIIFSAIPLEEQLHQKC